ncbi:hypothetical protein C8F04DRAFT_1078289 [Mycena alexandri]|uniref:F-box domain-containing protein n=1 Tax=Mycena alexandri TaxID=1745969 RepID=A0AAD6XEA0_9AGAR|nr:hypothetical protein C8F04DRAFT_1078289 [Mycena alexandri]
MAIHLLDLPPELLILILYHLDLPTLVYCLAVNRCLKSIIDGSTLIQYRLAAQAACVEDNPWSTDIGFAQKLLALQQRQKSFTDLVPTSICSVDFDDIELYNPCVYTLSGSFFALAEFDAKAMGWISLAATEPVLQRLEFPGYIQDLKLAIPEEDLLVVVLSSEPLDHQPVAFDVAFELRFYQMSTQSAHPMAREPVIHVPMSGARCPDALQCDICGPKCALVVTYVDDETWSRVLVYDWKLGCLLKSFNNSSNFFFLSPEVILSTRMYTDTFEMWTVSEDDAAGPIISL